MSTFNALKEVVQQSGLWHGGREETHRFLLSPDVFQLTTAQRQELEKLGQALFDVMGNLSHMATCVKGGRYCGNGGWGTFRRIMSSGVPRKYQQLQKLNSDDIPQMLKVDIMMGEDGSFRIAEIDGHNKHGMGYSTLGARFRQAMMPSAAGLPGTVASVADFIKRRYRSDRVMFLHSHFERFYIPEFEIAAAEFARHGVNCQVVSEHNLKPEQVTGGVFIDLPFLDSKSDDLHSAIASAYMRGEVKCVLPPKPFLGSKSLLAFLRNDRNHPGIANLLSVFVDRRSLATLRRYIPETVLVGRGGGVSFETIMEMVSHKRYVLKQGVASGMKGVHFSDNPSFEKALKRASKTYVSQVLQEEVPTKQFEFTSFDKRGVPNTSNDWHVRLTTHFVARRLAEITVTARRDKSVHGAPDCIQIGTAVVN